MNSFLWGGDRHTKADLNQSTGAIRVPSSTVFLVLFSICLLGQTRSSKRPVTPLHPTLVNSEESIKLSGIVISNPDGDCLQIHHSKKVLIEHAQIGPCGGHGISISGSDTVLVRNSNITDTHGNGVNAFATRGLEITNNRIERNSAGVYVQESREVQVQRNNFLDVFGPWPRGQFVQFNRVSGGRNRIICNTGTNSPGKSAPEDAINLFASEGVPGDPILVLGNRIYGGGPSSSGGGILLGDGGGAWQVARANVLRDPGQYGVAVAGGHNMVIADNRIYARSQPFTNVGIYVWNQYSGTCSDVKVEGNLVNWRNKHGQKNPRWNGGNCGLISKWDENLWDTTLDPTSITDFSSACD